jgi:hypothetical protein
MPSYRTSSLFHFTKDPSILLRILETGLFPNFCKEDLSYADRVLTVGVPMISFCDIPLTRTTLFKERYGEYAIGLTKEWALRHLINPILYVNDERILVSLGFLRSYKRSLDEEVKKKGGNDTGITINLSDKKSLDALVPFFNRGNAKDAVYSLYGYVKRFFSQGPSGQMQSNYIENEWRYVATGEGIDWKWSADEYKRWRGDGTKPEPSDALKAKTLTFNVGDISHIIVKSEGEVHHFVNAILCMNVFGGHADALSDDDRKLLLTKIISQEKIEKDF